MPTPITMTRFPRRIKSVARSKARLPFCTIGTSEPIDGGQPHGDAVAQRHAHVVDGQPEHDRPDAPAVAVDHDPEHERRGHGRDRAPRCSTVAVAQTAGMIIIPAIEKINQ